MVLPVALLVLLVLRGVMVDNRTLTSSPMCVDRLSNTTCSSRPGYAATTWSMNFKNSAVRRRSKHRPTTCPVAVFSAANRLVVPTDVIMSALLSLPEVHRQHRLRPVQGLDLRLFVEREHHSIGGRLQVQADHVHHPHREVRVLGELERTRPVRFETVLAHRSATK